MPEISYFYGIHIRMHYGDHSPPHFHAMYGDSEALVGLDGRVIRGTLPPRALRLVRMWAHEHASDLAHAWERAARYEPIGQIEPLS